MHKDVLERLQMQRAEIADRAKVRALLAHNGDEGQIAFASQRDLAARKHPDAIGIEQQAHHHRRIERRGAPRFLFIGGIETAYIQAANSIEQEEHQVPLGQLRRRALRLVLVALRLPRTIRFPTVLAHHGSPRVCVKEGWHTGKGIIALPLTHSNYGLTSWTDFFRGQAPS